MTNRAKILRTEGSISDIITNQENKVTSWVTRLNKIPQEEEENSIGYDELFWSRKFNESTHKRSHSIG